MAARATHAAVFITITCSESSPTRRTTVQISSEVTKLVLKRTNKIYA